MPRVYNVLLINNADSHTAMLLSVNTNKHTVRTSTRLESKYSPIAKDMSGSDSIVISTPILFRLEST